MYVEKILWVSITDETFINKNEIDNSIKLLQYWSDDETKKA